MILTIYSINFSRLLVYQNMILFLNVIKKYGDRNVSWDVNTNERMYVLFSDGYFEIE